MLTPQDPSSVAHVLGAAFPTRLAGDLCAVLVVVPDARFAPVHPFDVEVQDETVIIPSRIYNEEPSPDLHRPLTPPQQAILHCLYTRHHDGLVRQRHLEQIVAGDEPWVVPFVMQLVGEYVVEILEAITRGLPGLFTPGSVQRRLYGEFIARNPAFFARTERRVVSYWSCYYRWKYGAFGEYPGSVLLDAFRASVVEQVDQPWPRHTPPPSVHVEGGPPEFEGPTSKVEVVQAGDAAHGSGRPTRTTRRVSALMTTW
ncbi:hypothetical protein [Streptomyces olivaceus]|uniref:hypothetical protein n=1 Tax=Streptomyces olivaceus TaxID=47716 RepID=UPI0027DF6152|nr:hypothetical protein [Streptomyces olivaceus]